MSLAASVQPGEPRLHPLDVSSDLKINHVRKPAKPWASVLLTQVTAEVWGLGGRCGSSFMAHSRASVVVQWRWQQLSCQISPVGVVLGNVHGNLAYSMFLHLFKESINQLISHNKSHFKLG